MKRIRRRRSEGEEEALLEHEKVQSKVVKSAR